MTNVEPSIKLDKEQTDIVKTLARENWWASSIDLFSAIGIKQDDVPDPVTVLGTVIPLNDSYRRRVKDPTPYVSSTYEYADLLKQCAADLDEEVVMEKQFRAWLTENGYEQFKWSQQWRLIGDIAGVRRLRRRSYALSFNEMVGVVDKFLSDKRAGRYTMDEFGKWTSQWHGSTLRSTVVNTLGGGSWLVAKGLVFDSHKED